MYLQMSYLKFHNLTDDRRSSKSPKKFLTKRNEDEDSALEMRLHTISTVFRINTSLA